jgi:hypothetical protein
VAKRRSLAAAKRNDELFALEILMQTTDFRHIACQEYYAQSMSLVEFFIVQKGRKAFAEFLSDGTRTNYETAMKKHYGIMNFAELNQRWVEFAFPSSSEMAPQDVATATHRLDIPAFDR